MSLNVDDYFNDRIMMCDAISPNVVSWINETSIEPKVFDMALVTNTSTSDDLKKT